MRIGEHWCSDLTQCLTENVGVATHILMLSDVMYKCSNEIMCGYDAYDVYDAYETMDG